MEFRSVLYVPAVAPMGKDDIINPKTKNIRLYVKRVFISDDFDGELVIKCLSLICMRGMYLVEMKSDLRMLFCVLCSIVPSISKLCEGCCRLE